jgi:ribose 5-phosphate isomerase A
VNDPRERAKELAGRRAAEYVEKGMRVGLGTGSTVRHTILALGERKPNITCVATSFETHELATELGLAVVAPDEVGVLDIAIDGADEVDPAFNLIKGGGGAQTREKIVARMAARFVVVVDDSKLVDRLGAFGVPLEVLAFAPDVVASVVRTLGASEVTRRERPSDGGNVLMDARFGSIADPAGLARDLDAVPGLVDHGLFLGAWVDRVVVAGPGGVRELLGS